MATETTELYHVTNIVWDIEDEDVQLPTEAVVKADPEAVKGNETLIADTLSDHYGFAVESLDANPVPGEFPDAELQRLLALPQLDA